MATPTKAPSFLFASMRVFDLSVGEMLWSRRTIFMALVVGVPVLLALLGRGADAIGAPGMRINNTAINGPATGTARVPSNGERTSGQRYMAPNTEPPAIVIPRPFRFGGRELTRGRSSSSEIRADASLLGSRDATALGRSIGRTGSKTSNGRISPPCTLA